MTHYPLFRKENIPAYIVVMSIWLAFSIISAILLHFYAEAISFWTAFLWAAISVMAGMCIMFGASVINLRKLEKGFKRLADGNKDPKIPPVWCPVLTAATNAALDLSEKIQNPEYKK